MPAYSASIEKYDRGRNEATQHQRVLRLKSIPTADNKPEETNVREYSEVT